MLRLYPSAEDATRHDVATCRRHILVSVLEWAKLRFKGRLGHTPRQADPPRPSHWTTYPPQAEAEAEAFDCAKLQRDGSISNATPSGADVPLSASFRRACAWRKGGSRPGALDTKRHDPEVVLAYRRRSFATSASRLPTQSANSALSPNGQVAVLACCFGCVLNPRSPEVRSRRANREPFGSPRPEPQSSALKPQA
jgi:hypothetical protein